MFRLEVLTNRVNAVEARLKAAARRPDEAAAFANGAVEMRNRLVERHKFIEKQLALPEPQPVKFDATGMALIKHWDTRKETGEPVFDQIKNGDVTTLHINGDKAPCVASWRKRLALDEGKYKFVAKARGARIEPQESETGSGAGVRISGGKRQKKLVGDTDWTALEYEFDVMQGGNDVELVAELRSKKGEVWFDAESMKLLKVK